MKLRYEFEIMEIADESVAVPLGEGAEAFKGVVQLNQTGSVIMKLLKKGTTFEDILSELKAMYPEVPEKELQEDIKDFLNVLQDRDLIE